MIIQVYKKREDVHYYDEKNMFIRIKKLTTKIICWKCIQINKFLLQNVIYATIIKEIEIY